MAFIGEVRTETYTFRDHKGFNAKMRVHADQSLFAGMPGSAAQVNQMFLYFEQLAVDLYACQTGNTKFLDDGTTPSVQANGPYTSPAQDWTGAFNSSGAYQNVEDKAVLFFQDANGVIHKLQIAGPLSSLFMADQMTCDVRTVGGSTVLKQFIADVLNITFNGTAPSTNVASNGNTGHLTGPQGAPFVNFIGGLRQRRKNQRKLTIFTLSGNLDEPAE